MHKLRQAIGAQDVEAVDPPGGGQVAQPFQRRTKQRGAAVAFIAEAQLRIDRDSVRAARCRMAATWESIVPACACCSDETLRIQRRSNGETMVGCNGIAI